MGRFARHWLQRDRGVYMWRDGGDEVEIFGGMVGPEGGGRGWLGPPREVGAEGTRSTLGARRGAERGGRCGVCMWQEAFPRGE